MIINQDGTSTEVDEDKFVELAGTRALNGFNAAALRAMFRWYEKSAASENGVAQFDAYAMARQWREVDGQTMVEEFGQESERGRADASTVANVRARLEAQTTVVALGEDHYLIRIQSASGPSWDIEPAVASRPEGGNSDDGAGDA